jgi:ribulose-bisphosphate carboxylase large chain
VLAAGGTCVMVAVQSVGLAAVGALRRRAALPIHGHRAGWGALTRAPALGADFAAWHKLWRLAGVDHLHCNGLRNKFWEPDDSVVRSVRACLTPLHDAPAAAHTVMPVLSSGQWAGQAPDTYERMGTRDLVYLCGGGIIGHPGGVAAGVASVRQAWEAALAGRSLAEHARTHPELAQALAAFGAL